MAEVGTILAIIQVADRVASVCKHWIESVQGAPADFRSILIEISLLKTIFKNIHFLVSCSNGISAVLQGLTGPDGPIEHCLEVLKNLEELLPSNSFRTKQKGRSKKRKINDALAALAWPLKETKARKLLEELIRYKTSINLALTTDTVQDIKGIKNTVTQVHEILTDVQRREVYRWLQQKSTNPSSLHNRAQAQIEQGTCSWMLRTPEWTAWLNAKQRCLWVGGIPGAGKTVLAAFLTDEIQKYCEEKERSNDAIASIYYYCYFGHDQDEAPHFLRWLIVELCRKAESVPSIVYALSQRGHEPSIPDLLKALEACVATYNRVYIILDAIDESKPRDTLLKVCRDFITDSRFQKIQLLATSRLYLDIERVMDGISKPIPMSNSFVEQDIRLYVRSSLQTHKSFQSWSPQLLNEVEEALSTKANGMFRWAVCQIDRLRRLRGTPQNIRAAIANLPKTLDETYERIFLEVAEENRWLVQQTLRWIDYHNQLYSNGVPCEILVQALERSHSEENAIDEDIHINEETLRELCGCLIRMAPGKGFDYDQLARDFQIVSFAHYTVREFLGSDRISTGSASYYSLLEKNGYPCDLIGVVMNTAMVFEDSDNYWGSGECYLGGLDPDPKGHEDLHENFETYCAASAIPSITHWSDEIGQQAHLADLALDLLDPASDQSSLLIFHVFDPLQDQCCVYTYDESYGKFIYYFRRFTWLTMINDDTVDAMRLLHLLSVDSGKFMLANIYLQQTGTEQIERLTQTTLSFTTYLIEGYVPYKAFFIGSIIEIFAQLSILCSRDPLLFLLGRAPILPDPTAVLFSYIGSHLCESYTECAENCTLKDLIHRGADPQGKGYRVTPLQIAAAARDHKGARILLEAGVDPNWTGDSDGIKLGEARARGEPEHLLERFNKLEGLSPMSIVQSGIQKHLCDQYFDGGEESRADREAKMIEVLLQYGAK